MANLDAPMHFPLSDSATAAQPGLPGLSQELSRACSALWLATLSLMTAYMHQRAPAHRYLLARRIARNLDTLQAQDCFDADCRQRFAGLARRWEQRATENHPQAEAQPRGWRAFLFGSH